MARRSYLRPHPDDVLREALRGSTRKALEQRNLALTYANLGSIREGLAAQKRASIKGALGRLKWEDENRHRLIRVWGGAR